MTPNATAIFPTPALGVWNWKWPVKKTPSYKTLVQTPAANVAELRVSLTSYPIWSFELDISYLMGDGNASASAYQTIVGFLGSMQGQAGQFLYDDPEDDLVKSATPANCTPATGDGATTLFQTTRQIGAMADLIQNFNGTPIIYLGGVAQATGWTLDNHGNLTFTTAPGSGVTVQWSGAFYFLCRFLEDEWTDLQEDLYQIWSLSALKWKSLLV